MSTKWASDVPCRVDAKTALGWELPGRAGRDMFHGSPQSHLSPPEAGESSWYQSFPRFLLLTNKAFLLLDNGRMPYGEPILQLSHTVLCLGIKRRPVKDLCFSSFLVICSHASPPHSCLLLVNPARECQVSPGSTQHLTHTVLFHPPKNQPGFLSGYSLSHTC